MTTTTTTAATAAVAVPHLDPPSLDVVASSGDDGDAPAVSLEALFRSLARHSRVFPLRSEDVTILPTPTAFYEQLLANISTATHRLTISSLYLGTGDLERRLVAQIAERLRECPTLEVTIVLDHSRGQRGGQDRSSVSMLKPLLAAYPERFRLSLYKVPQLRGLKASLPPPFNETLGVSHAKVYLADDTLILSGANLSEDYFTNRQDRYVQLARCGGLADFYDRFVRVVAEFSHRCALDTDQDDNHGDDITSTPYVLVPPAKSRNESRKRAMKRQLEALIEPSDRESTQSGGEHDTWAFPTLQFNPIDLEHDQRVLSELVPRLPAGAALGIASGYLNFPPFLEDLLIRCRAHLDILTAAPSANGFFNAAGVKGALPMAYSLIEQDFYERTRARSYETHLREFNRPEWTFHGKGMWFSPSRDQPPELTIMGSSNFGRRSYGCDLESQLVLFTRSPRLRRALEEEYRQLQAPAELVTEQVWARRDRSLHTVFCWKYGHWIRPVSKLISAYL